MPPQFPAFSPDRPILIAGPTASGKSALALDLAERQGRCIVNADALQVYDGWHLLTARPSADDESRVPHLLYGHVDHRGDYSVGQWLRDVRPHLRKRPAPIIVGGTGLYFMALIEGLAEIPATSATIRALAMRRLEDCGLDALIADLDAESRARIDLRNPMRVQRAWEVQKQTGRGIAAWHGETGKPDLPVGAADRLVVASERGWLNHRIDLRFDRMMEHGALEEAARMEPGWAQERLSSKAIGAAQLIAALRNEISTEEAVASAKIASHQYAKRQRTWFRRRMRDWHSVDAPLLKTERQKLA